MTQGQAEASREDLLARIAELEKASVRGFGIKVSQKGAISVYGLGRLPVTLYASQWRSLLERIPDVKSFLDANKGKYAEKATKQE